MSRNHKTILPWDIFTFPPEWCIINTCIQVLCLEQTRKFCHLFGDVISKNIQILKILFLETFAQAEGGRWMGSSYVPQALMSMSMSMLGELCEQNHKEM